MFFCEGQTLVGWSEKANQKLFSIIMDLTIITPFLEYSCILSTHFNEIWSMGFGNQYFIPNLLIPL